MQWYRLGTVNGGLTHHKNGGGEKENPKEHHNGTTTERLKGGRSTRARDERAYQRRGEGTHTNNKAAITLEWEGRRENGTNCGCKGEQPERQNNTDQGHWKRRERSNTNGG